MTEPAIVAAKLETTQPGYKKATPEEVATEKKNLKVDMLAGIPVVGGIGLMAKGGEQAFQAARAYTHGEMRKGNLYLGNAVTGLGYGALNGVTPIVAGPTPFSPVAATMAVAAATRIRGGEAAAKSLPAPQKGGKGKKEAGGESAQFPAHPSTAKEPEKRGKQEKASSQETP